MQRLALRFFVLALTALFIALGIYLVVTNIMTPHNNPVWMRVLEAVVGVALIRWGFKARRLTSPYHHRMGRRRVAARRR